MKIFFYLILFCFFTNNSFALDREAKARKLYVENAKILKNEGCSTVLFITDFSKNFILQNENNEMTKEQVNIVIKLINCLDVYKKKVLPNNEILLNEYSDTEATFKLVTKYYLSEEEIDELEDVILNLIGRGDLPNLLDLLDDLAL
tara:strand:- start:100 stop:537 length:438 start_codon:yes stop_codon:yes gene_type:complete